MNSMDESELECRVCRSGPDLPNRPLYAPCLCSGSIGLVHQDCLETWLNHAQKEKCELCGLKYQFAPLYAENTPSELPYSMLISTIFKKSLHDYIPYGLRVIAAILVWLGFVPLFTCQLYRMWMRLESFMISSFHQRLKNDTISGFVLAAFIILTFIVIMLFLDFLRFHGVQDDPQRPAGRRQGGGILRPQQQQPMRQPPPNNHIPVVPEQPNIVLPVVRPIPVLPNPNPHPAQEIVHVPNRPPMTAEIDEDLQRAIRESLLYHQESHNQIGTDNMVSTNINTNINTVDHNLNESQDIIQSSSSSFSASEHTTNSTSDILRTHQNTAIVDTNSTNSNTDISNTTKDDNITVLNDTDNNNNMLVVNTNLVPIDNQRLFPEHLEDVEQELEEDEEVEEDVEGIENELPMAEGEIRFAFDELIGLRGFTHLCRNAWLLLAFNCVYIGLFAAFPYLVGMAILRFAEESLWFNKVGTTIQYIIPYMITFMKEIIQKSAESGDALQFLDVIMILLGYTSLFTMIFVLSESLRRVRELIHSTSFINMIVTNMTTLSNVIKVGLLLFIRVFVLPISLGIVLLACCNIFLGYTSFQWTTFIADHISGATGLAWVTGISYMVCTTLSVLQLREILHPDYLARSIRPQEPHIDLLISLMTESSWTHFRRICSSMVVYLSLTVFFVLIPVYLSRQVYLYIYYPDVLSRTLITTLSSLNTTIQQYMGSDTFAGQDFLLSLLNFITHFVPITPSTNTSTNIPTVPLYFYYYIPQIQIPIELAITHLCFLTLLDKKKNIIGRWQHKWLVIVCQKLGLSRFILPHLMKMAINRNMSIPTNTTTSSSNSTTSNSASTTNATHTSANTANNSNTSSNNSNTAPTNDPNAVDQYIILRDRQGNPVVGPPIRRPPPGWDSRTLRNTTRWAWGTETKSSLESHVAPRLVPSFWLLRVMILLTLIWITVTTLLLFVVFIPIVLGRYVIRLIHIPEALLHDPACFLLGGSMCWLIVSLLQQIMKMDRKSIIESYHRLPLLYIYQVIKCAICWISVDMAIGYLIYCIQRVFYLSPQLLVSWIFALSLWVKGTFITSLFICFVYYGYMEKLINYMIPLPQITQDNMTNTDRSIPPPSDRDPMITKYLIWCTSLKYILSKSFDGLRTYTRNHEVISGWDYEYERLVTIWNLLLWPAFDYIVLRLVVAHTLMNHILIQLLSWDTLLYYMPYLKLPTDVMSIQLYTVLLGIFYVLCTWSIPWLHVLTKLWWHKIHATVLDENFLIGRQLLNSQDWNKATTS